MPNLLEYCLMKPFTVTLEQAYNLVHIPRVSLSNIDTLKKLDARMNSQGEWEIPAQKLQEQYPDDWRVDSFVALVEKVKQEKLEQQVILQKAEIDQLKKQLLKSDELLEKTINLLEQSIRGISVEKALSDTDYNY